MVLHLNSLWNQFFNSHPHKEDDDYDLEQIRTLKIFNSHPHKEDDHSSKDYT